MSVAVQYALCCLGVDESQGLPSFQNVFRTLPVPKVPYKFPAGTGFFLVVGFSAPPGRTVQPAIRVLESDGTVAMEAEVSPVQIDISGFFLLVQFFEQFEVYIAGPQWLEILVDGARVSAVPISVVVASSD